MWYLQDRPLCVPTNNIKKKIHTSNWTKWTEDQQTWWPEDMKSQKPSLNYSQMFRQSKKKKTQQSSNKHTDLQNTISFKIEMLQKDFQTLSSHCLSPVKIFCPTSSTSVPTQICCAWLPRWKDVQIKGPITASVPLYPISQGSVVELQSKGSV